MSSIGVWVGGTRVNTPPSAGRQVRLSVSTHPFHVGDVVVRTSMRNYPQYATKHTVTEVSADTDEMIVDGGVGGPRWVPMSNYSVYEPAGEPEPVAELRTPQAGDRVQVRATGDIGVIRDVWFDDGEYHYEVAAVYRDWSRVFVGILELRTF